MADALPPNPETPPPAESGRRRLIQKPDFVGPPKTSMVRDSAMTFATQILNIVISIGSSVILGRAIAPIGKGVFAVLTLIPRSAWTFGSMGLDQVNTVYAGRHPEKRHELATTTLAIGLGLSLLVTLLVSVALYWPGKGAAKVGILSGDFIVGYDGRPIPADGSDPLAGRAASDQPVPVTVWRQGTIFDAQIPVVPRASGETREDQFRLSPLNTWAYGLTGNPRFAAQQWLPAPGLAVLPLTEERWAELLARATAKLIPGEVELPEARPALLVTQVGESGKLKRLLSGGVRSPLRVGDLIIAVDNQPLVRVADDFLGLAGAKTVSVERDGTPLTLEIDFPTDLGATEERPLAANSPAIAGLGLSRGLHWQTEAQHPSLGLSVAPLTPERRADLDGREAAGLFAEGTTVPQGGALLVTNVAHAPLRQWLQDVPRALFLLAMLFLPLTVTAYLIDSVLYGLNLIALRNQKTIVTSIVMFLLYFFGLYLYGVRTLGLNHKSVDGLIGLLWIAVILTLIHGAFILAYSFWMAWGRATFHWKYLNFPLILEGFRHIGWQAYIANSASYLFYDIDVLIIKNIIEWGTTSLTYDNLGNYTQATNIVERVWIVPGAIATSLLPKIAGFGDAQAAELSAKAVRHTLILTLAILIPLALAMPFLVPLLWGPDFLPLLGPFYVLAPGILLFSVSKVFSSHLLGIGKPKYAMRYSVFTVFLNVALNYLFVPMHGPLGGINGAALASTIAYTVHSGLMMLAYSRETGIMPWVIFRYSVEDWQLYVRSWQRVVAILRRRQAGDSAGDGSLSTGL